MLTDTEAVQSTSNDALRTKVYCVDKTYFKDNYIYEMDRSKEHKKFLPLINRGTFCRYYAINNSIRKILNELKGININIIVLGSGFETLYFNLLEENYSNITFYEFDYKKIIDKKVELIQKSKKIMNLLKKPSSNGYNLVPCDITKISDFEGEINKIQNNFTIVISECLLVYIKKKVTVNFLSVLTKHFDNLLMLEYDLIGPDDPFGIEMIQNLKIRGIILKGFDDVKTIQDQIQRAKDSGFDTAQFISMLDVYNKMLPLSERKRIDMLEMMDEFEEFNLLQEHACFGYAGKMKEKKYESLYGIV